MAGVPPSDPLHQPQFRLAVNTVYYAVSHALARNNANLLVGAASDSGRSLPGWTRAHAALGGEVHRPPPVAPVTPGVARPLTQDEDVTITTGFNICWATSKGNSLTGLTSA